MRWIYVRSTLKRRSYINSTHSTPILHNFAFFSVDTSTRDILEDITRDTRPKLVQILRDEFGLKIPILLTYKMIYFTKNIKNNFKNVAVDSDILTNWISWINVKWNHGDLTLGTIKLWKLRSVKWFEFTVTFSSQRSKCLFVCFFDIYTASLRWLQMTDVCSV